MPPNELWPIFTAFESSQTQGTLGKTPTNITRRRNNINNNMQIEKTNFDSNSHSSTFTSVNNGEITPVSSLISHQKIPCRQKEPMISTCALTLITCHLFNRGFKGEFIDSIIVRLLEDQKVTGISPKQVFTWANQQILQVNLTFASVCCFIFGHSTYT